MMKSYLFQIWGGRLFLFIGCLNGSGSGVLGNKWLLKCGGVSVPFMCLEFRIGSRNLCICGVGGSLAVQKQSLTVKLSEQISNNIRWEDLGWL